MKRLKHGFTLVELVIIVSVVTVLMSIIVPSAQKILNDSKKAKARNYMKQIAVSYCRIYQSKGFIPNADSGEKLVTILASYGELNNANLFVFPGDASAAEVQRETIYPADDTESSWQEGGDFSVYLVGNIDEDVNMSTTPIAFSRGLKSNGSWGTNGVYGSSGGYVAFLDGSVRWYDNLSDNDGKLSVYNGSTSTANIGEAIPSNAIIFSRSEKVTL